ncbi:acyl carrier protein [Propionivibrio sp.]|uniref:acyl carrier protein n=1 Tax=Propionivibrio sp. TaxID=2212460 RepID=UPI00262E048C|nr:acyl carrier protein [Propionivibrio sp.]
MTKEEICRRLTEIFRDVFDSDLIELSRETVAADIEEWDSLNHIRLIVVIEKEFLIHLKLEELKTLKNVGDMLDLIERKIS